MRLFGLLSFLNIYALVLGQEQPVSLTEFSVELPVCAQECIIPVLDDRAFFNTSFSDLGPKLCHDIPGMREISSCLQTDCSFDDHVVAWQFQNILCENEPSYSEAGYIRTITITMALVAAVFVLLRVYSRTVVMRQFWWDDILMLIAAILMIAIAALMIWNSTIGLGLHAWDIKVPTLIVNGKIFLVMKVFYIWVQVLLKVSILVFFLRCLPVQWVQRVTWVLIVITIAHGVAFFFAILFQCSPIEHLWNKRIDGRCIELRDIIFPGAIFSILEDVAILVIPIPCLSSLSVGKGKKISLIAVFSVGFVATLCSIIRAKPVWVYRDTLDESWDVIDLLAWSEIELTVATICVCLPSIKPILNKYFPRYFSGASSFESIEGPGKSPLDPPSFDSNKLRNAMGESKSTVTSHSRAAHRKKSEVGLDSIDIAFSPHALQGTKELEIYREHEFEIQSEPRSSPKPRPEPVMARTTEVYPEQEFELGKRLDQNAFQLQPAPPPPARFAYERRDSYIQPRKESIASSTVLTPSTTRRPSHGFHESDQLEVRVQIRNNSIAELLPQRAQEDDSDERRTSELGSEKEHKRISKPPRLPSLVFFKDNLAGKSFWFERDDDSVV